MLIEQVVLGVFETNSYILRASAESKDCVVVDTGLDAGPLMNMLAAKRLNPLAILLTHGHADHTKGIDDLRQKYPDILVVMHKDDAPMLTSPVRNMSVLAKDIITHEPADILIKQEGPIEYAGLKLYVLHTPGHTPGGVCFYSEDDHVIFVGDTLFHNGIGRTDLPGGNHDQLIESIKSKLIPLHDKTVVYPGHGPKTSIKEEKQFNPFLA
ncbi:Hydroxyacylglutathione hydrolase [Anaerohalosphaera lusitana]|uniref:Hydroxyacylglutathione hydrolase n=1 Tax=Anaerohalosphaera lusitana TaxID=1936003 RepID=A0A1U9NGN4_9BACT|nr:MBL fold metallo-hydrolase [Anaerohalosphaera lusitana]AQT67101.1 Hydroxyacylglutathione hydrolase [Anaerohalosphaera lusitana]